MKIAILITTLLLTPLVCLAADVPSFKSIYSVEKLGMSLGTATIDFKKLPDNRYEYRFYTRASGIARWFVKDEINEVSKGQLTKESIHPDNYHYKKTGGSKDKEVNIDFDWAQKKASVTGTYGEISQTLDEGGLDRLVVQLAVMQDMGNKPMPLNYRILDKLKIKNYSFIIDGKEELNTPVGTISTIIIKRANEGGGRVTRMWIAPALHHLPIRIRQDKDKEREFEMNLKILKGMDTSSIPRNEEKPDTEKLI